MNTFRHGFWLCLLLAAAGCDQGLPVQAAEQAGKQFASLRAGGEIDKVLDAYAAEFFNARPRAEWREYLLQVESRLGRLRNCELRKSQYDTRYSARFYILEYQCFYAKGKAWERLTYVNPIGEQVVNLVAHQIKSEGL